MSRWVAGKFIDLTTSTEVKEKGQRELSLAAGLKERHRKWFWQNRAAPPVTTHNEVPWSQKITDGNGQSRREGQRVWLHPEWKQVWKVQSKIIEFRLKHEEFTRIMMMMMMWVWPQHHFSLCLTSYLILQRLLVSPPVINTHTHTHTHSLIIKDTTWL